MSSYDEHLITQAGGDGDPLDASPGLKNIIAVIKLERQCDELQKTISTQQATIDRVWNLANTSGRCGWRISADELRKTLGAS